ncbi:MAG TPA: hypothetical protein ENN60_00265 [archaeon]|nr:hypothetical protein [archaeon]
MKGATPIIAVILLLLITIAAGGATYLWLSRIQDTLFTQTGEGLTASSKQIYGKIDIISAWNETTQICLLLRNLSEQQITYTEKDLESLATLINNRPYDFDDSSLADVGQGETFVICICNASNCGSSYYAYSGSAGTVTVKVEPPFGDGDTYDFSYP